MSEPIYAMPVAELGYAPASERLVYRPLYWLILVMPIATMLYDIQQIFWFVLGLVPGSPYGSWSGPFLEMTVMLMFTGLRVAAGVFIIILAGQSLRSGRVGALPWACLAFVIATLIYSGVALITQFSRLFMTPVHSPILWRALSSLALSAIGSSILPTVAFFVLLRLKRDRPDF